jgi:hypothetical protein
MKVFCYRNLRFKKVMWSVKDVKTNKVISRSPWVVIKDAELKVSLAGNKRVRKEKRKNVHAGIKGQLRKSCPVIDYTARADVITYNPYENKTFITAEGVKVNKADFVILTENGAVAINARWEN